MNKIVPQINYKSVLQPIKNIEKRNKAFHALDNQSKRLEIAWDCLNLICSGKVGASPGYEYWSNDLLNKTAECLTSRQMQNLLLKKLPERCRVCVRGGMMLSQIRIGNTVAPNDFNRRKGSGDNIEGFSVESFAEMEREYEYGRYNHPYACNSQEKLANICCNVLINGNFNTKDKTDYLTPRK